MRGKCVSNCVTACYQIFDGVKPTLGELEKFEATPEEVEVEGNSCCYHYYTVATCVHSEQ